MDRICSADSLSHQMLWRNRSVIRKKKKRKTNELSDDFHEVEHVLLQVQSTAQSRGQLIFFHRGPDSKYFQLAGHILLCRCGTKEATDDT